mgnify:FL=1
MFIPPKSDVCIKELFRNETVLRYFVSAVLAVPPESICTIRMKNTFLWRSHRKQKQGILDVLEIHILELHKKLEEDGEMEEWIRFFRAESEEDLNMQETKNPGILEAIREVRTMSLSRRMRLRYEAHMKQVRDERAWKTYEREEARKEGFAEGRTEGLAEGRTEGLAEGRAEGRTETFSRIIGHMIGQQVSDQEIIRLSGCSEEELEEVKKNITLP